MASSPSLLPAGAGDKPPSFGLELNGSKKRSFAHVDDSSSVTSMSSFSKGPRDKRCYVCKQPEEIPDRPLISCKGCRQSCHPACPRPKVPPNDFRSPDFEYFCIKPKCHARKERSNSMKGSTRSSTEDAAYASASASASHSRQLGTTSSATLNPSMASTQRDAPDPPVQSNIAAKPQSKQPGTPSNTNNHPNKASAATRIPSVTSLSKGPLTSTSMSRETRLSGASVNANQQQGLARSLQDTIPKAATDSARESASSDLQSTTTRDPGMTTTPQKNTVKAAGRLIADATSLTTMGSPGSFRDSKKKGAFNQCTQCNTLLYATVPGASSMCTICKTKSQHDLAKFTAAKSAPAVKGIDKRKLYTLGPDDKQLVNKKRKRAANTPTNTNKPIDSTGTGSHFPNLRTAQEKSSAPSAFLPPPVKPQTTRPSVAKKSAPSEVPPIARQDPPKSPQDVAPSSLPSSPGEYETPPTKVVSSNVWGKERATADPSSSEMLQGLRVNVEHRVSPAVAPEIIAAKPIPANARALSSTVSPVVSASAKEPPSSLHSVKTIRTPPLAPEEDEDEPMIDAENMAFIQEVASEHPDSPLKIEHKAVALEQPVPLLNIKPLSKDSNKGTNREHLVQKPSNISTSSSVPMALEKAASGPSDSNAALAKPMEVATQQGPFPSTRTPPAKGPASNQKPNLTRETRPAELGKKQVGPGDKDRTSVPPFKASSEKSDVLNTGAAGPGQVRVAKSVGVGPHKTAVWQPEQSRIALQTEKAQPTSVAEPQLITSSSGENEDVDMTSSAEPETSPESIVRRSGSRFHATVEDADMGSSTSPELRPEQEPSIQVDGQRGDTETVSGPQSSIDSGDVELSEDEIITYTHPIDPFLKEQANPINPAAISDMAFEESQIWAECEPHEVWPKQRSDDFYDNKRKEILARGPSRTKKQFGVVLKDDVRQKRAERGWSVHQQGPRNIEREQKVAATYKAVFGIDVYAEDGKTGIGEGGILATMLGEKKNETRERRRKVVP